MDKLILDLNKYESDLIRWRRDLHQIPELGLELPNTVKYVTGELEKMQLTYDASYVNGNGISVVIEGEKAGDPLERVLGIRADMDGLPIKEETGLDFASQNNNMHACGHDGHTAILLGVAKFLSEHRELFKGKVKLIFQPGEEFPGGAKPMIEEGVLKNPDVTAMIGTHIGNLDKGIPEGKISYRVGPVMASMDRFQMWIKGQGFHAAYPENSKDPIIVANNIINNFQTIKSRNVKATDAVVVSITHIEGGYNQNIIPDQVFMEGTVRALNEETRQMIYNRMKKIIEGTEAMFDVKIKFNYEFKYPPVSNDPTLTEKVGQVLSENMGSDRIVKSPEPLMGGEDFAFFSQAVPATFLFLSNPGKIEGAFHGHHHAKFDIDEQYLKTGLEAFIYFTLDYLN